MTSNLDRLAEAYGIPPNYISETGELVTVTPEAKRGVLAAMGIVADTDAALEASLAAAPADLEDALATEARGVCFVPDWLQDGRCWGVTCQLYGLRSGRNWGIGDFDDLARLAEIAAAVGADFVGVNPLHPLFLAEPARCSPFSPSTRRHLNPLYIAVDCVPGFQPRDRQAVEQAVSAAREKDVVDYPAVATAKLGALAAIFARFESAAPRKDRDAFRQFLDVGGDALRNYALFETVSGAMVERGHYSGWHSWPEAYQAVDSDAVRQFAAEHADRILFHGWLQWLADDQLRRAQGRARDAGMRVGLYLDFAVGVAPDGAETWGDPELVVPGARVGAPPGYFNQAGQDWGLAPLSPAALEKRSFEPFRQILSDVMRRAGAIRIDHAMGLTRLFWIPENLEARYGAYVRYPTGEMFRTVAEVSQRYRAIVIGEDLGTVPPGFRELMHEAAMHGYRVLYFERRGDQHFIEPHGYQRAALAVVSTHDLPPLRGWWLGRDIIVRHEAGVPGGENVDERRQERERDKRLLCTALAEQGLLPHELDGAVRGRTDLPRDLPESLLLSVHRYLARSPARLLGVQLEDLTGTVEQPNVPGTVDEQPNWRHRLAVPLEQLAELQSFRQVAEAVRSERPRQP
ncbi:MAG TPA: 4-alpha-glucanotransferase [Afifellaceae bacterium]|nr:4-alpha-glucanotransferase [Afifellaceae bacterium]